MTEQCTFIIEVKKDCVPPKKNNNKQMTTNDTDLCVNSMKIFFEENYIKNWFQIKEKYVTELV